MNIDIFGPLYAELTIKKGIVFGIIMGICFGVGLLLGMTAYNLNEKPLSTDQLVLFKMVLQDHPEMHSLVRYFYKDHKITQGEFEQILWALNSEEILDGLMERPPGKLRLLEYDGGI